MYKPGKKRATILIIRSKGNSFEDVHIIAEEFIQTFLESYLNGVVKGKEKIEEISFKNQEDTKIKKIMHINVTNVIEGLLPIRVWVSIQHGTQRKKMRKRFLRRKNPLNRLKQKSHL